MSELSYKELQEQGVFDVPYRAFEFMQSQQAKIDELQARVADHDLKLELFINELEKTYREDKDNKIDYWRGFSECADSSVKVFYRDVGFINLKGNKDGSV